LLGDRVEWAAGDLTEAPSLAAACHEVQTVVHLACHISADRQRCEEVNGFGTEALVESSCRAGVKRIIYVSSAAVYGYAMHAGATEDEAVPEPATPVSRSRVRAERAVLGAGGIVLRPLFVYGGGDTRFIPVVIGAMRRLPFVVNRGKAIISVISVDDLADAIVAVARLPEASWQPGAYHATDGHPLTFRSLVECLRSNLGIRAPRLSLPYALARLVVRGFEREAVGTRGGPESAAHRLFLVARDHYYDSSRLSQLIEAGPLEPLVERFASYTSWYRRFVDGSELEPTLPSPVRRP
jgi:nucleoside-diphosphate-sugar epimerase